MATLPWRTLLAYFVPVQVLLFVLYGIHRYRQRSRPAPLPALPTVRTITSIFGNTAQVGIPIVTALYGPEGLGLHVTVMGLHGLTLLSTLTVIVEMDLARARVRDARAPSIAAMALTTLRNTIIHPVVLPLVIGWAWNLSGLPIPAVVEDVLELLSLGVVPVSLVVIGLSLAYYGLAPRLAPSLVFVAIKLILQPAFVLLVAHWGFGLTGLPLSIVVLMGALPVGANALIFAQRYETHQAESATAIVISTFCYAFTLPAWLFVLSRLPVESPRDAAFIPRRPDGRGSLPRLQGRSDAHDHRGRARRHAPAARPVRLLRQPARLSRRRLRHAARGLCRLA